MGLMKSGFLIDTNDHIFELIFSIVEEVERSK